MEIEARLIDIPALLGRFRHHRLHAFLRQLSLMAQRLAFQMALEAGNLGFGRHLRQVKAIFRNTDRADPVRKIVHHDPVGTLDPLARITVFHLFACYIQRIALHLDFRVRQPGIVFQQR